MDLAEKCCSKLFWFCIDFLTCPDCGLNLTGSASKGRKNHYYYYHCVSSCGFHQKAEVANDIFEKGVQQFELNSGIKNILKRLLRDNYKKFVQSPMNEKKRIAREIDTLNARLSVARNKLLSETIDDEEYLDIKMECRDKIEKLEEQLSKDGSDTKQINIDRMLDRAIQNIVNIPRLYSEVGIHTKRAIIGSIFPEKLEFDGKTYRTARMNVVADCIFQLNNGLPQNKKRRNENNFHFSFLVAPPRIELGSKV